MYLHGITCKCLLIFANVTYVTQCYESSIVVLVNAGKQLARRKNITVLSDHDSVCFLIQLISDLYFFIHDTVCTLVT